MYHARLIICNEYNLKILIKEFELVLINIVFFLLHYLINPKINAKYIIYSTKKQAKETAESPF